MMLPQINHHVVCIWIDLFADLLKVNRSSILPRKSEALKSFL